MTNLRTRHSQFLRRSAKHYLALAEEQSEERERGGNDSSRPQQDVSDENSADGTRKALGRISKRSAKSSGALRSSSSKRLTLPVKDGGKMNASNNGVPAVRVFVEERYAGGPSVPQADPDFLEGSDEVQWKDLGTHADRTKENTGMCSACVCVCVCYM